MSDELQKLFEPLKALHKTIRDEVVDACERYSLESLSEVVGDSEGDTTFAIDRVSEELIVDFVGSEIALSTPIVLIGEGIENGKMILPQGTSEDAAVWRIIVDPIDGTRGLMYQKRAGWILTGVAPNRGSATTLRDIVFAMQTEIPMVKQHLSDMMWAYQGSGLHAERFDRVRGTSQAITLRPSSASTISQGYSSISRFFPGARDVLAAFDDVIVRNVLGVPTENKAQCFEDQYISTGGQLYELIAGHDRFIADLRPLLDRTMKERGLDLSICCHPYDLCTELIAREAGVVITDVHGDQPDANLDIETNVSWIGYANDAIRRSVEPHLRAALEKHGLMVSP